MRYLTFCLFCITNGLCAQNSYNKFGLNILRHGFAVQFEHGTFKKNNTAFMYGCELGNVVNPNEINIINPNISNREGSFKLEKIHRASILRTNFGFAHKIKGYSDKGILPIIKASIGPSITAYWPMYINYVIIDSVSNVFSKVEVKYDPNIHNSNLISESAFYTKGTKESIYLLGLHAKAGIELRGITLLNGFKSLEIGAMLDYYGNTKLPLYFNNNLNKNVFTSFYLTFALGQ